MSVNIGSIIAAKVKSKRIKRKNLYIQLNTSRQNLYDIFKRESIDTNLLLKFCQIVNYDFFSHYYLEDPLKTIRQEDQKNIQEEIRSLRNQINLQEKHNKSLEETVMAQKKLIQLLEKEKPQNKKKKN